ncbi:hypothetical protein FIBSPDRAFT_949699 [Athelia psychrophila]|uniref:Uncharacterized protein n=1 Tax=Athelia psychrophila TaxID=1759441 RepID=A0A166PLX3_9AGAM|nr:hypothetical protein FIBSPDRAFT_949699 [Fibularhizoctonia sp. CBS 109695]
MLTLAPHLQNTYLKRKASQELRNTSPKRSVIRQSSAATSSTLKRKASTDLRSPSVKRRTSALSDSFDERSEDSGGESSISAGPLGILNDIPREILYKILSWSSTSASDTKNSLYTLTCVSKSMAELALPQYIRVNKCILPKFTHFHIGLSKDAFYLFPAWICSDMFVSRDDLICHFTFPNIERKIDTLDVGLSSLCPALRPKSVIFEGDLNLTQGLSLLDIAGRTHTTIIDLEVYHLDWSTRQVIQDRIIHTLAQTVELRIEWPSLSSQHWCLLLRAISAPQLRVLTLGGDVPWTALASFLSRHSAITKLHLPASLITRVPQKLCALQMPKLLSLKGKLTNVVSFIKLLSRSSNLSIESEVPSNTPLIEMVHKIVKSLTICDSDLSLVANLTSTKPTGPLTKIRPFPVKTLRKWREFPDRLAYLTRLRLIVMGMEDLVVLGHCKNMLSVFPGLRHVTLRRNGVNGGWEWARITHDVDTSVTWGCMESSDYLESSNYHDTE